MDLAHDVGAREVQHLGAVLLVPVVIFDGAVHRLHAAAHGAVAEQNLPGPLVQQPTRERPPARNRGSSTYISRARAWLRRARQSAAGSGRAPDGTQVTRPHTLLRFPPTKTYQ